jgi:hypothetical protein
VFTSVKKWQKYSTSRIYYMKLTFNYLINVTLKPPALLTAFLRLLVLLSHQYTFPGMYLLTPGFLQIYPPYNLNRFPQTINSRIITNLYATTDFRVHATNLLAVTSPAILVVQTSVIRWRYSQCKGLLSQIVSFAMFCKLQTERLRLSRSLQARLKFKINTNAWLQASVAK